MNDRSSSASISRRCSASTAAAVRSWRGISGISCASPVRTISWTPVFDARIGRIALLDRDRRRELVRVDVRRRQPFHPSVLDDVDAAPIREHRHRQAGDGRQRRLVVQRRVQLVDRLQQEPAPFVGFAIGGHVAEDVDRLNDVPVGIEDRMGLHDRPSPRARSARPVANGGLGGGAAGEHRPGRQLFGGQRRARARRRSRSEPGAPWTAPPSAPPVNRTRSCGRRPRWRRSACRADPAT